MYVSEGREDGLGRDAAARVRTSGCPRENRPRGHMLSSEHPARLLYGGSEGRG